MSRWRWLLLAAYLLAVYLAGMAANNAWIRGAVPVSLFYLAAGIWFAWCVTAEINLAVHNARIDALREARDRIAEVARRHGIEVHR